MSTQHGTFWRDPNRALGTLRDWAGRLRRGSAAALAAVVLAASTLVLVGAAPAAATFAPSDGDVTYKEYWVPHSQFSGSCASEPRAQGYWYLEPSPCAKSVSLTIPDDVSGALRAEVYLDLWRNRNVPKVRFQINGGRTYAPDVGSDWSRTPWVGDVELSELVQGVNTLRFTAFFPVHVHDIAVRVYYDASHPLVPGPNSDVTAPTGGLTTIVADNGTFPATAGGELHVDSNQLRFAATASDDRGVAHVDFIGRYEAYDIDADGVTNEWQAIGRNNFFKGGLEQRAQGGLINHLGSDATSPYDVTWNLLHVPNQSGVAFKVRIVDTSGNVRETAGGPSAPFELVRRKQVELYASPANFQDFVLHHEGTAPDVVARTLELPDDLTGVSAAYLVGNYWNNPFVAINGNSRFRTHESGEDTWALSIRSVPVSQLGPGINDLVFEYRSPGFGQFVEKPGPMIVLHRDMPDPAAPSITAQPVDTTISAGMEARFTATATGSPMPTYQWLRDGEPIEGANAATYTTPRVAAADDGARYSVRVTNRLGSVTSDEARLTIAPPAPWWDTRFPYRLELVVGAAGHERRDKVVQVGINFTTQLASVGEPGQFDPNAVRVVEVGGDGAVTDDFIQYQFNGVSGYHPVTNADGNLFFMMKGTTAATTSRRYHVYFAKAGSGIGPLNQPWSMAVIDNVISHGQKSFRVETPSGVWTYQKDAGGFSSLHDVNGNDWISYNLAHGGQGTFRGIPNAIFPEGQFHPGDTNSRTTLLNAGPIHAALRTTTLDGRFGIRWDFYPTHATAQITKATANYWFLYEGTPGGKVDLGTGPGSDYVVRADGTTTPIGTSWAGDLPGEEWLYFADGTINRSIFLAHHDDDNAPEYYQHLDGMTVFGFGRKLSEPQLRRSGEKFTVGLMDTRDHAAARRIVEDASKDLLVSTSLVQRRAGNTVPGAPQNVLARPRNASAIVSWDPLVQHGGAVVTSFVVTPSPTGDPVTVPGTATEATVPGLTNGQPYTFTVSAVNDLGRGAESLPTNEIVPTPVQAVASEDFNRSSLGSTWEVYDPNALDPKAVGYPASRFPLNWQPSPAHAAKVVTTGTELVVKIPGGRSADLWTSRPFAPRITQETPDGDFQVELKYENDIVQPFQFQGFIAEQDKTNFLRFDVLHATAPGFPDGTLKLHAASIKDGQATVTIEELAVTASVRHLRVTRVGNRWTLEYSADGDSWHDAGSFTYSLRMTRAGVFAGSHQALETQTPELISRLDYLMNTAAPIDPEDAVPDDAPLQINGLLPSASDTRVKVKWETDELSTGVVKYGLTTDYELGQVRVDKLDFDHEAIITGLDEGTDYHVQVVAEDVRGMVATSPDLVVTTVGSGGAETVIALWSGDRQSYGQIGQPQKWINVLGKITDVDGVDRAYYTINGDPTQHPLTIGRDDRRLAHEGDINIDIAYSSLRRGANSLTVHAFDSYGNETTKTIDLDVELARAWPLPYTADWSTAGSIEAASQIVDGKWRLEGGGLRPVERGYDRLVAIGDLGWTDYEVTVPITLHGVDQDGYNLTSAGPAVGLILRWPGHYDWDGSQPRAGFAPLGALGWYRFQTNGINQLVLSDSQGQNAQQGGSRFQMQFNRTYMFKMAVQTEIGAGAASGHRYTLSVWEQGQPEQTAITLSELQPLTGVPAGSAVLVAHHADATFGNVEVRRINQSINPIITPASGQYSSGQQVSITTPAENATIHYTMDGTVPTTNSPVYTGPFQLNVDAEVRAIAVRQGLDQSAVTTRGYLIRKGTPIVSDDFSGGEVNTALWTELDPRGDVTTRTSATDLLFDMPGGGSHDLFDNRLLAPRLLQSAPNTDFGVETRIMDTYSGTFTQAGILVHQTFQDFLRFDVYRNGARRFVFAASFANGTIRQLINREITVTGGDVFLRVTRAGHDFTLWWSDDGTAWTNAGTFNRPMKVTSVGPWAGSHSNTGPSPAFVGTFDYFFNMASPIANEDGQVNNVAPVVDAGPARTVTMPASASLDGTVTDDGKPEPPSITTAWALVAGPGHVTFADPAAVDTSASFSRPGVYHLKLTASDGQRSAFDMVTVTVAANPGAPVVAAGPSQTVTLDAGATLSGTVTDDGLPAPPQLSSEWSVDSGPGTVTFADAASAATTASFSAMGTYLLRLTATDGEHTSFDQVEVRVVAPRETAGLLALYDFGDAEGTVIADVSANGPPLDLHIGNSNHVSWTRTSLRITQAARIASHETAQKIVEPIKASDQLTVEVWVRPDHLNQIGPARIVGITKDSLTRNFMLGQGESAAGTGDRIHGRLRTTSTDANGLPGTTSGPALVSGMQQLVFTRTPGGAVTLYRNGVAVRSATVDGTLANWDPNFFLAIANEYDGGRPWLGEYELLAFYDRALTADQVANHYHHGPEIVGGNLAPVVDAGPDLALALPAPAELAGTVTDDRRPTRNGLRSTWSVVSGPGPVTFDDAGSPATKARFEEPGTYVLALTGDDGIASTTDTVTVEVEPEPPNDPPVVDAGPDRFIEVIEHAQLDGAASDDGNPFPGILTVAWSKVSGPGSVTFADSSQAKTTALFSVAGTYVLRLTADDGEEVVSDTVTVEVRPPARAANGLVALYGFDGPGTVVRDISGVGTPLDLTVTDPARVAWDTDNGTLTLTAPTTVRTTGPATKLNQALAATSQFTVEAWIDPAELVPSNPGRIATISHGNDVLNLTLSQGLQPTQSTETHRGKVRTSGASGTAVFKIPHADLQHVVLTRNHGDQRIYLYIDGVLVDSRSSSGNFSNWDQTMPLLLGDEPTGSRAWLGTYHYLAFYNRPLSAEEVRVNRLAGPDTQRPPDVDAGPDRLVQFPEVAELAGSVTDDGLPDPPGALEITWSKVSGPGTPVFTDRHDPNTTVGVDVPGTYVLRLEAFDGQLASSDTVTVRILENQAPVVAAGADRNVEFPSGVTLTGAVTDDGLPDPPGAIATLWSQVSGPGTATIADPEALTTAVSFDEPGLYVLRLHADDGELDSSDTVSIDVRTNRAPVVDAGPDQTVRITEVAVLDASVTDDGLPATPGTVTVQWSKVSGPGTVTFASAAAVDTTATFSQVGTYVLRLTASDGAATSTDDVTVSVVRPTRVSTALRALYDFDQGTGTVVPDVSGVGTALDLTITDPSRATWVPGGLRLDQATRVRTAAGATKVIDGARATGQITMEAWITPAHRNPPNPGRVMTISDSDSARNATVGQGFTSGSANDLYRARATGSGTISTTAALVPGTNMTHLVYILDSAAGRVRMYVDGILASEGAMSGNLSTWSRTRPLSLGNEPVGNYGWLGTFHLVAMYDRALTGPEVQQNFLAGESSQLPPTVDAGPDQTVEHPSPASLDGTVSDDGLPASPGRVTVEWSKVSGPGTVTFADAAAVDTTATFSVPGTYVLRLSASDGALTTTDEVTIRSVANAAPVVDAGPDQTVEHPAPVALDATVTDDGLPSNPGAVTTVWSKVSGPGTVTFTDAAAVDTTVTFSQAGTYVLRLTGSDGALESSDDVTITSTTNVAPTVDAGPDGAVAVGEALVLDGTVTDDGLPSNPGRVTTVWSLVSGPGTATFEDSASVDTSVTFSASGDYVLQLHATDGALEATDTMVVTVSAAAPVAAPVIEPAGGTYHDQVQVQISSSTSGAAIHYTTDGSVPTTSSPAYTAPFVLTASTTVRAIALKAGRPNSEVTSVTYTIESSPRVRNGLVALYHFDEAAGTTVRDTSGVGSPMDLTIGLPGAVAWEDGSLRVNSSTQIATAGPATKMIDALKASDQLTIEAWITPASANPASPGRIATVSDSETARNVVLSQGFWTSSPDNTVYESRMWTTSNYNNPVASGATKVATKLTHVVLVREAGAARLYVDGVQVGVRSVSGAFDDWNSTFRFLLANEGTGNRPWLGTYHLVAVYDRGLTTTEVGQNLAAGTLDGNQPPKVDAGPDKVVEHPSAAALNGSVSDDGLPQPPGAVSVAWSKVSGPGTATFADPTAAATTVEFSAPGSYVLRLTADDGDISSSDEVTVLATANSAPVVDAGPDLSTSLDRSAVLDGTVTDDGLPASPGAVTVSWSMVSGPGTATFAVDSATDTTVSFDVAGTYVLQLLADDGALQASDTVTVTVTEASPRASSGLLALYTFHEGSGNVVSDVSGVGTPMNLTIADAGAVSWSPGTLAVGSSTSIATAGPATKMIDALKASDQLTIEAWITPASANPASPGRIATVSDTESARNVVLSQGFWTSSPDNTVYESRMWTTDHYNNPVASGATKVATKLTHVVLVREAGAARLYVDGVQVGVRSVSGAFDDWNSTFRFLLANEGTGNRPWLGTYHLVAVYDRGLTATEVGQNFAAGPLD